MAALVQTFPQQSGTVTMLQARPSSASGMLQGSQNPPTQYPPNTTQSHRNSFHGMNNAMPASSGYRGSSPFTPIAPYAFKSTPSLNVPPQRPSLQDHKAHSSPAALTLEDIGRSGHRSHLSQAPSVSTTSSSSSSDLSLGQKSGSRDDSSITLRSQSFTRAARPQSTIITSASAQSVPLPAVTSPIKAVPDRYRRTGNRRTDGSQGATNNAQASLAISLPNVVQFYGNNSHQDQRSAMQAPHHVRHVTADDLMLNRHVTDDQSRRSRRRSIHVVEEIKFASRGEQFSANSFQQGLQQIALGNRDQPHPSRSSPVSNGRSSPGQNGSTESVNSSRSGQHSTTSSSSKRDTNMSVPSSNPASSPSTINKAAEKTSYKNDTPKGVTIPPRASSSDAAKRISTPSPLSKPVTMSPDQSSSKDSFASVVNAALRPAQPAAAPNTNNESLAVQQLAALNEKESKKSKTSRLRRAFSFGSAAELRKVSAQNAANRGAAPEAGPKKEPFESEEDAEHARIVQQQEAGGIGSGIYNGQGNFFSGSTDNLSISSTASSASIMIRKMGKGMKRSTRSLVGLFRPKSVIGVPAADSAIPEASRPEVSRVTVEAEREKVNVSANPREQPAGATGFPKLERNSVDAANIRDALQERVGSSGTDNSTSRRSIVGGDKERAEVLAAVKKGILKRSGTDSGNSSPVAQPFDDKATNITLPHIPTVSDSPNSSAPSTPKDDHKRNGSVTIGGEDYFMSALRFRGETKSSPGTPHGGTKRNATFSPRIQFHDTWPSGEYDRRGEIATCNRLTPMLAQQIKEELNTFKMVSRPCVAMKAS
ncbi:hypothetical protein F5884DRAFT_187559 [Xylogone sp. PMI_703]|nr:hypothetical protein F5884DRAFT_187559 [Xylogone sp. PMI_703]